MGGCCGAVAAGRQPLQSIPMSSLVQTTERVARQHTVPPELALLRGRNGMFVAGAALMAFGFLFTAVRARRSDAIDVAINGVWICKSGATGEDRDGVDLTGRSVHVVIDLHAGTETATILTNDLSHAYVHENSAYST